MEPKTTAQTPHGKQNARQENASMTSKSEEAVHKDSANSQQATASREPAAESVHGGSANSQQATAPRASAAEAAHPKNPKPMLAVLLATAFIAAFNENIINVGLTDIMAEFSLDAATANWLVTGYMIVTAIVVTAVAFLLRRFNLRTIFFGGATLFIIGSALAMMAPTFPLLLICRLLQAVGTGVFIPTMMNTVLAVAPRKQLGPYLAIGSCCITFGPAFGPVVSGAMVTAFGWRTMFLVPMASMIVLLIAGALLVYNFGERQKAKLDVASLLLSIFGLTALVYGLSEITGNLPVALVAIAVGLVLVAAFARRQGKLDDPMLNLQPLRNPRFALACLMVVVAMMTTFSMSVLLPLFFQGAVGTTAFVAGLLILPPILAQAATSMVGGRIMDKRGEWPLLFCGFAIIAAGLFAVSALAPRIDAAVIVIAAAVVYAGVGFAFSPSQTAGLKQLPHEMNPFGVGIMSTFIQISAALGPSLFVGILSNGAASAIAGGSDAASAQASGFSSAVMLAAIIGVAGCVLSLAHAALCRKTQSAGGAMPGQAAGGAAAPTTAPLPLTVAGVMKRDAYTVAATAPVYAAVDLMLQHHTSGLPVTDTQGGVVGFISDGDIMKSLAEIDPTRIDLTYSLAVYANDSDFDNRMNDLMRADVLDVATTHVISVDAAMTIERVCAVLGERRIKKVPVLDGGKLVGTISRNDINRQLMESFVEKGKAAAGVA